MEKPGLGEHDPGFRFVVDGAAVEVNVNQIQTCVLLPPPLHPFIYPLLRY